MMTISSCNRQEEWPGGYSDSSSEIEGILVTMATRDEEEGENTDAVTPEKEGDTFDKQEEDYDVPFTLSFDENSVVFISQQTEDVPPFQLDERIYQYQYMANPDANWEKEYNFTPRVGTDPLEWFKISHAGTFRGGFQLFALYFPLQDNLNQRLDGSRVLYSVQQDQSTLENLIKSDILGAYHSTSELFTRLRFKLWHLMTYMRIKLYVPVYDPETKTGFYDDALISASLDNVTPEFAIDWRSSISTDDAPTVSRLSGTGNIIMYQHPLKENEKRAIDSIEYKKYLASDFFEQPIKGDFDYVRVYDFSVIMPMQGAGTDAEGNEVGFTQTNFLNFLMRSNAGAENNYTFNQTLTANTPGSYLNLTQGIFQVMELYVPRVGNKLIMINATLHSREHQTTTFPLYGAEEETDNENKDVIQ